MPIVRVMSSNIRFATILDGRNAWSRRKAFYLETVRAFDPDLIGIQEALSVQRDDLASGLGAYSILAAGRADGLERGEMMAVLYRTSFFEWLDSGHFWLSATPDRPGSKGWGSWTPRMVTWAKFLDRRIPDRPLAVFNTHLDHLSGRVRLESIRLLRRKADTYGAGCRIVITGDFNVSVRPIPLLTRRAA
jgi:endonuclease/exonuclease/phosphatase family metal-dependent hydrolase